MKDVLVQLDDLPEEILTYIFKKLHNDEVLYSLMYVNQRFNRIIHDTIFTDNLCLLEYCPYDDSIFPLSKTILDRFCSKILPDIGHKIKTLYLEGTSIERILNATNYPNLNKLGFCDIDCKLASTLFLGENIFTHISKSQISTLFISFNNKNHPLQIKGVSSILIYEMFTRFTNLQCIIFNPCAYYRTALSYLSPSKTVISSTLLELHIIVSNIKDCFCILDGRFDQLRILYITLCSIYPRNCAIVCEQPVLPNLRILSLYCKSIIYNFDESIVALLRRTINLEELYLDMIVQYSEKFIDGNILRNNIINYMPRLYKLIFNIQSIVYHRDKTDFPLNEYIQKTFDHFSNNQTVTCIDHFHEKSYSQCHIYSYPYKSKVYNNITNNFQGGLFINVTKVLLYDEYPFEDEFFLRIAQSFPFMRELIIENRKAQNNKQFIKSNNNNEILSIIQYPYLIRLDLSYAHDDYLELFLFNTKISLSNNLHLRVDYQSLKSVTYNFTRYTTLNNSIKLTALYFYKIGPIDEYIRYYFPYSYICRDEDFVLCE